MDAYRRPAFPPLSDRRAAKQTAELGQDMSLPMRGKEGGEAAGRALAAPSLPAQKNHLHGRVAASRRLRHRQRTHEGVQRRRRPHPRRQLDQAEQATRDLIGRFPVDGRYCLGMVYEPEATIKRPQTAFAKSSTSFEPNRISTNLTSKPSSTSSSRVSPLQSPRPDSFAVALKLHDGNAPRSSQTVITTTTRHPEFKCARLCGRV